MRRSHLLPLCAVLAAAAPMAAQTHPLPRTGELIDSATFAAVVGAHAGTGPGKLVLTLTIDSAGRVSGVRVFESKVPEPVAALLADSVVAYVRPQEAWAEGRWWVRLVVEAGAQPTLRVQRPRITPPVLVSAPVSPEPLPPRLGGAAPGRAAAAYRVLVDVDGSVLRFAPLASNVPDVTEGLRRSASQLRYRPGTVDDVPDRMWKEERPEVRSVIRVVPSRP